MLARGVAFYFLRMLQCWNETSISAVLNPCVVVLVVLVWLAGTFIETKGHTKMAGEDRSIRAETHPLFPGSDSSSWVMTIEIMFGVLRCGGGSVVVYRLLASGGGLAEGCAVKAHEHRNAMRKQSYH